MTSTCDLCDAHPDAVTVLDLALRSYGGRRSFHGAYLDADADGVLVAPGPLV